MKSDDIYAIKGRVGNILAREDIALSPVGNILINSYVHVLSELYAFAEKFDHHPFIDEELIPIIRKAESMPATVIKLSQPKEPWMSLYDQVMDKKPLFKTNKEALKHYQKEYEDLTKVYGFEGDDFWAEAESSDFLTPDHEKIMRLNRYISMLKYLIGKENGVKEYD